ncbi:MAG: glycosyltransferase family 2 protein [Gemmatimonadaceae bacterium]
MDKEGGTPERITYLIASHNQARYVGECLASLRTQTDSRWLAVVVDDASTDGSREVIAPFLGERVRLLVSVRNAGYIATLRRLIAEATTDIVAILDADDTVTTDATETLLRAYEADAQTAFVHSRFAVYDDALATRRAIHGRAVPPNTSVLRDGEVGHIRSFRRSAYARTAGLDDAMLFAEDRDLVYKLEEVARPVFVDAVLYNYREVAGSQSRDPAKREIGARNTWMARRAALARRGIAGRQRVCYEAFFAADYVAYSERPPAPVRVLARWVAQAARLLCRAHDPRLRRARSGIKNPGFSRE